MEIPGGDRLSGRATRAVTAAGVEAAALHLPAAGAEALLLGCLLDADGIAAAALRVPPERVRAQLAGERPDLGPDALAALAEAVRLADASGCGYVGAEHVLLGALSDATGRGDAVNQLLSASAHTDRAGATLRVAALLEGRGEPHDVRLAALVRAEAATRADAASEAG